nr:hypothetical protein Iba_scaffold8941CG0050 [Ipomoea batatas]GME21753.1 hypothetical protein Iba_scaffold29083CG0010 [Ipomoea batatas]
MVAHVGRRSATYHGERRPVGRLASGVDRQAFAVVARLVLANPPTLAPCKCGCNCGMSYMAKRGSWSHEGLARTDLDKTSSAFPSHGVADGDQRLFVRQRYPR